MYSRAQRRKLNTNSETWTPCRDVLGTPIQCYEKYLSLNKQNKIECPSDKKACSSFDDSLKIGA